MDQPHNDYLRILYDFGMTGMALYVFAIIWTIVRLMRLNAVEAQHRWWKYALASTFIPYLLLMITDNILLYAAFFGNLQFVLIGSYLSFVRHQRGSPVVVTLSVPQSVATGSATGYVGR